MVSRNRVGGKQLPLLDFCVAVQLVIGSLAVLSRLMSADASIAATDGFIAQKGSCHIDDMEAAQK